MDFVNPGLPGGQKKGSIFAGLIPASAPSPAATPAPTSAQTPAPRPAADAESAAVLKQKMDALEKNIVSRLEKKIAEQFKANPSAPQTLPAAPPDGGEVLLLKIAELERRLEDFSRQAGFSASQLRNIEESKISARREIEELLKAAREQQKYSEIDRQMHSQLEKSWVRVEELEKKLMDFYASILALETKRKDDIAGERGRDQHVFAQLKDTLGSVARCLEALKEKTMAAPALTIQALRSEVEKQIGAGHEAAARRQSEFFSCLERQAAASAQELRCELERQLAAECEKSAARQEEFFSNLKRQAASSFAASAQMLKENSSAFRSIFEDYLAKEMTLLGQKINGEVEALKAQTSLQAASLKDALAQYKAASATAITEFAGVAAENKIKADEIETALGIFAEKLQGRFEELTGSMLAGLKKDNDERFEKFGAKYGDPLASLSFIEAFQSAAGAAVEKLSYIERVMGDFIKSADREGLARAAGVSGMLKRESFNNMEQALGRLRLETEKIENIRASLSSRFKDIFKGQAV